MKRVRLDALLLVLAIVAGYAAYSVPAPRSAAVIPSGELRDAETDRPQSGSPEPAPRPGGYRATSAPVGIPVLTSDSPRPASPSASRAHPKATARPVAVRETERPLVDNATSVAPQSRVATISAPASWYCGNGSACTAGYPASCLCAAAGPALRVGNWRGRWVTVTTSRASVRVRLIDTCGCPGGRALDLYGQVFAQLAPHGLSDGIVSVRISW